MAGEIALGILIVVGVIWIVSTIAGNIDLSH